MIPSYQEEIRIHRNKDRIFWAIVALLTVFLYFFFQGYYPNYERFFDKTDVSKQAFLKPFGIIDIHVFPSPDEILINNEPYNNNSKTIFDLGEYTVSIQKKWYLSIVFPLDITKKNPFYTNVVNLFSYPKFSVLPFAFNNISFHDNFYLLQSTTMGLFLVVDTDFWILHSIQTPYRFIGGLYFTDGNTVFSYSLETEKFLNVLEPKTGLPLQCKKISYYTEKLFCHDTMQFIWPNAGLVREKVLDINDNIIVTQKYIYNQDNTDKTWKYFEYETGSLHSPESVVHINKIPYILKKGVLSPIDKRDIVTDYLRNQDWWMDHISQVETFDGETILIGEKEGHGKFRIIDTEKQYAGKFDFKDTRDVKVYKISGNYIFTTSNAAYIYYKGAKEIIKILDGVEIVRMIDAKIFFNKEGKSYVVDLLRKEVK